MAGLLYSAMSIELYIEVIDDLLLELPDDRGFVLALLLPLFDCVLGGKGDDDACGLFCGTFDAD
jgi:hypothetical protein